MAAINPGDITERRSPQRHVALALLSAREEVLLVRPGDHDRYRLPLATVSREADDDALNHAVAGFQTTLLADAAPLLDSAWLGRFAALDDHGRPGMLEVYVARLGEARLRRDTGQQMAWAPLLSTPPEGMLDPAIELQVMPALALLITPDTSVPR